MTDDDVATEFGEWAANYSAGAGDAAVAIKRLKELRTIRLYIDMAISDLEKLIAEDMPVGTTETPLGVVTVRQAAETFAYPKAGTDEFHELFDHVVARLLDKLDPDSPERPERQMALFLRDVWPMGPQSARSGALKKLGLNIGEYRLSEGRKKSVQVY